MSELLETAFRRFERAAQQLEQRHRALELSERGGTVWGKVKK